MCARSVSLALVHANSPSLKHLNSSRFKTLQRLFSRPLYKGLGNISITCGKLNELNLSRVSVLASRAAKAIALVFRRWTVPCLAERSGFGSSRPGPSVGTAEASLPPSLPPSLPGSLLAPLFSDAGESEQYVADQQRGERVCQGAGSRRSVAFVCCPQRGEEQESCTHLPNCLLPRLVRRFPSRRNQTPKKAAETYHIFKFKNFQKKLPSNSRHGACSSLITPCALFENAYGKGKNGNIQSLSG